MSLGQPKYIDFVVEGTTGFPIDMLRYDSCYPIKEEQAHQIEASIRGEREGFLRVQLRRVNTGVPITVDRWKSFGWRVIDISRVV